MVVSREEVLAAIRRETEAAGGVVPGIERFEKATGIRRHEWYGVHWAGWGEALTEAGYAPNVWGGDTGRTTDELAKLLAEVVRERGRWPSPAQVGLAHRLDPRIPAANTLRLRLGPKPIRLPSSTSGPSHAPTGRTWPRYSVPCLPRPRRPDRPPPPRS